MAPRLALVAKHLSCHKLRHTAATLFYAAGTSDRVVQELLGHADSQITLDLYVAGTSAATDALHLHHATGRMEEGELLGRSGTDILMEIAHRVPCRVPVEAGIGDGLIRTRLVFGPDRQRILRVRRLDQLFLGAASGSMTITVPLFRFRTTVPGSHQL